jgi:hypothetical protein
MKDYLGYENERNKKNALLYQTILQRAWGKDLDVLVGHHICFEQNKDIKTENEIPSADTLMFDHEIMTKVFGDDASSIMASLARAPVETRDYVLSMHYVTIYGPYEVSGQ